ncbi:MAG: molybdopterin synthase catalytic subunit MoaE [Methylotenera sp.]|nr:molybdopterin synthase catalytic subunit MoaE [Methylotenera sp.]
MSVRVQLEDFDVGFEISQLRKSHNSIGAVVSFVGLVRDLNERDTVTQLTLEHYPGMTEKSLMAIIAQAKTRWHVEDALIIHRVGPLMPNEQIVLVAVTSAHRGDAFSACEFIMDYLKTDAPFWKKEITPQGAHWVEVKSSDDMAKNRWNNKN